MNAYVIDFPSIKKKVKNYFETEVIAAFAVTNLGTGLEGLDAAGYEIIGILRKIGFWIIMVKCTYDLIQCALKGDKKGVGSTIITYVIVYGSLFFVPWMLSLVSDIF